MMKTAASPWAPALLPSPIRAVTHQRKGHGAPASSPSLPRTRASIVRAATTEKAEITFAPFQEVQPQLTAVQKAETSGESFARTNYDASCEAAVNEQINIEYNISYIYHSLYSFFGRANVGLPGFAEYFKRSSAEEREHAEKLMEQQNRRGGKVRLQSILLPETEFDNPDKGDALYAMELSLSLEKLNFIKLRELHRVACDAEDAQLADFIEGTYLQEQAKDIKRVSDYVSQLRRVGKGLGVFEFDKYLSEVQEEGDLAA